MFPTFGASLYPFDRYRTPQAFVDVAMLAERLGFESVTIGEHVVVPKEAEGSLPRNNFDSFVLGATLAAHTTSLKIFFSILVVPYYNPVRLAKAVATLDFMSGGRVIVGVGAGWLRREFDVLGADYDRRGAVLDESLRVMRELWTSPDPSYHGEWTSFEDVIFEPRPHQKPYPPIWVGGWGSRALRRAAELGDGMYPSNAGPLELMIADKDRVTELLAEGGRADAPFTFGHAIDYGSQAEFPHLAKAISGRRAKERVPLVFGFDPEPVLDHLRAARDAGFRHIGVRLPGIDEPELMDSMKRFHDEVMQPLRSEGGQVA